MKNVNRLDLTAGSVSSAQNFHSLSKTPSQRQQEWRIESEVSLELTQKWLEQESDPNKIASLLFWKSYNHSPGWYVRSCDPITGLRGKTGQFKPDLPLVFPDSDKPQKYLSFPKGEGTEAIYAVMTLNDWLRISEAVAVTIENTDIDESRDDLGFWLWVKNHPEIPIVITEGAKKAGCLLSQGYSAIALCGVWNGQIGGKKLHPSLSPFIVPGRPVYLAFDADLLVKENVEAALRQLGRLCKQARAEVFVVNWDLELGKGCDDLIVAHGAEAFRAAMEEATSYNEWLKKLDAQFSSSKTRSDRRNQKTNAKPPNSALMAAELAEKYRERLAWDDQGQTWMRYEATIPGVWEPESKHAVEAAIAAEFEADPRIGLNYSKNYLTETIYLMRLKLLVKKWESAKTRDWIPMADGVLELAGHKLHPHSPGWRFTWALPYRWADRAIGCEPIQQWLLQMMQGDQTLVQLLRAYLKAIVIGATYLQRFLECIGAGGSGKSTFIRVAMALVGRRNCAVTELKQLEQNRFEVASLHNKRLIAITDADKYGGSVNTLKAITGQDELRLERKNIQSDGNGIVASSMVVVAANEVIQSSDYTSGLQRRRLTLMFNNPILPEKQRNLIECQGESFEGEFVPYLPGLLAWVLEMDEGEMVDLLKNTEKSVPSLARVQLEKLCDTNPLAAWSDECLSISPQEKTYVGVAKRDKSADSPNLYVGVSEWLYASYAEYTNATGHKPISQRRFTGLLHDLLVCQLKLRVERGKDRRGSYFEGVTIRPDTDLSPRLVTGTEPPSLARDYPSTSECDGSVMGGDGYVMAATRSSDGCDGCDGLVRFVGEIACQNEATVNELSTSKDLTAELESLAANPSQKSQTVVETELQAQTDSSPTHHNPSSSVTNSSQPPCEPSPFPTLVGRRIRSLVTAKVGVVKELIRADYIPVMVIVQFDGDEFTIPTSPEKLAFEDGSPFPKLESASTVSEKETESPQLDWSSYPHLTSSDNRAAQKRASEISLQMLSASNVNELKALSSKYTRTEIVWIYRNLLSAPQRQQIVAVAAAQQLSLLGE